jgi:cytochrome c-type biogenesis protein CcmH/NrfG
MEMGRFKEAVINFKEAIKLNPSSVETLFQLGQ